MTATQVVLVVAGTLLAAVVGSFLGVVVERLPVHLDEPNEFGDEWDTCPWREVVGGRSHCADCGAQVRAADNVPIVSWLVLRGRCRSCGARIPGRLLAFEVVCPLLFLGAVWAIGPDDWRLLPALWLIPVGVAVAAIDQRTLIVPTRIVWPALAVSVALSVVAAGLEDEWSWLLTASVGLLALSGPLFALWFIHPRGLGFGDVRLTVLLGWHAGLAAGERPIAAVVLVLVLLTMAAVIGIIVGVVALGARGRKAQVPFGPSLVAATFLCVACAPWILAAFRL